MWNNIISIFFKTLLHTELQRISVFMSCILFLTVGLLYWPSRGDRSDWLVKHSWGRSTVPSFYQDGRSLGRMTWEAVRNDLIHFCNEHTSFKFSEGLLESYQIWKLFVPVNNSRLFFLNDISFITTHIYNVHGRFLFKFSGSLISLLRK